MITKVRLLWAACVVLSITFVHKSFTSAQEAGTVQLPTGIEVLTRGPVHEAFAQPLDPNSGPGQAVPKEPPPPINEKPPEQQPPGDNIRWIPGYWAWDVDRNDYVWVSGTFRNAPPGRQFVEGHWVNTKDGWHWVSGFWAPDSQTDLTYAAQPPETLNAAPAMPPPDENSNYVPGYWFYQDSSFIWRPGFYMQNQQGRIWVAPRYVWTPAGYIFVNGYWDYPLEDRGMLFAPIGFDSPVWQTADYFYRPNYWVSLNPLYNSLFWRPGWNQYYFGNYYGSRYARLGFQPLYRRSNDSLSNYYAWANRGNGNWLMGQQRFFSERHAGLIPGPALTFAQQTSANRVVAPLNQFSNNQNPGARLTPSPGQIQLNNALSQSRLANENFRVTSATGVPRVVTNANGLANGSNTFAKTGPLPSGFNTFAKPGALPTGVNTFAKQNALPTGVNTFARPGPLPTGVNTFAKPIVVNNNSLAPARVSVPQTRAFTPAPIHTAHTAPAVSHAAHSAPAHSGGGHGGRR